MGRDFLKLLKKKAHEMVSRGNHRAILRDGTMKNMRLVEALAMLILAIAFLKLVNALF